MNWPALMDRFRGREYHEGTTLANRLGFQLLRTLAKNAEVNRLRKQRERQPNPILDALERDGIAVVPDFLPADVFASVLSEQQAARHGGLFATAPCVEDNGVIEDTVAVGKNRKSFPVTWQTLGENEALRELVGHVIGRTPSSTSLSISVMRQSTEPTSPTRLIGANYIHADAHFPTVKAWLYLNDISERNGAFIYAPGSHRLTLARLAYEYEASVRVARANEKGDTRMNVPYGLVRMPTREQLAQMGIVRKSICGRANTLIVVNTMGFHQRGEFQPTVTRDMLAIRFGDRGAKHTVKDVRSSKTTRTV